ncbi:MAG: hypothetical protein WDA21_00020 [Bacilli bacterium]
MNNNDDFSDLVSIKETENNIPFKINKLKLVHYYFNDGDMIKGEPIKTSIEIKGIYDFEKQKVKWIKTVSHTYYSFTGHDKETTDSYSIDLDENHFLISELEKNDLRNLKNNYFTEADPERLTYWEIWYNYYFKIVGTYDREVEEFKKISKLLDLKQIITSECNRVKDKLNKNEQ